MQEFVMSFASMGPIRAARVGAVSARVVLAACSAAAVSLFAANAQAKQQFIEEKIIVKYADLDLSKPQDVRVLYSRLRNASDAVCGAYDVRDQRVRLLRQVCYDTALESAVVDVNRAAITELHAKTKRFQVAQGELRSPR
jgi:UrcA family protein